MSKKDENVVRYEVLNEGTLKESYELWRKVAKERPNAVEKDIGQFEKSHLKTLTSEDVKCFFAYDGPELIGACILDLRPKDANPYLDFLVPKERLESELSNELLEKSIELCKEKGKSEVELSPNIYPHEFIDFFKEQGFKKREQYPSGLWMKKSLEDLSRVETSDGIDIFLVEDLEGPVSAKDLAEVQLDYANPNYELEDIIDEFALNYPLRLIIFYITHLKSYSIFYKMIFFIYGLGVMNIYLIISVSISSTSLKLGSPVKSISQPDRSAVARCIESA